MGRWSSRSSVPLEAGPSPAASAAGSRWQAYAVPAPPTMTVTEHFSGISNEFSTADQSAETRSGCLRRALPAGSCAAAALAARWRSPGQLGSAPPRWQRPRGKRRRARGAAWPSGRERGSHDAAEDAQDLAMTGRQDRLPEIAAPSTSGRRPALRPRASPGSLHWRGTRWSPRPRPPWATAHALPWAWRRGWRVCRGSRAPPR